ncbi:MAG TPA: hypothetical protein PKW35_18340, partial [Nannocystaceae bacterium]|nr:hypothetical protein [Nannocystaceae bacterium]
EPVLADAPTDAPTEPVLADAEPVVTPAEPVLADTPANAPVVAGAPAAPATHSRTSSRAPLLAAYSGILQRIQETIGGDIDDRAAERIAVLAEAAAHLVDGDVAERLLFGKDE